MLYADVYFRRVQIEASMTKGKITLVQRHSAWKSYETILGIDIHCGA